jgi:geranylgeranyl diphosphate synthase type II
VGFADELSFAGVDGALVQEVLGEYGTLVRERLGRYLPRGEPRSYLYELLADYPRRGGKMIRSSLCIAAARSLGASVEEALPSAVAIELMHNALLVHDDIEDASDERRGTPTLHALHGIPLAINAGDALGLLSLRPLKDNIHRLGLGRCGDRAHGVGSTEGQAWAWQRDRNVGDEDYLQMVLQKTCWLTTIHPLRVGCLIGTHGRRVLDPLVRIGFFFGAAFQIQDDVLNLEGGPAYGKERNGDLLEGKRTLMIVHALRSLRGNERKRLAAFLGQTRASRSDEDVAWVRALLDRVGAIDYARTMARALAGAALFEFDRYFDDVKASRDLRFMRNLVTWVMDRAH